MRQKIGISLLAMSLVLICCMSCQKEGIYKPKKKLKQLSMERMVYYYGVQIGNSESYTEHWTWENKLLKSITKDSSGVVKTMTFTYKGKTIHTIESDDNTITYSYKNGYIDKIELSGNSAYMKIIVETRDKGDMVTLRYEISGSALNNKNDFERSFSNLFDMHRFFMPEHLVTTMQKSVMAQKASILESKNDISIVVVTLQYNSDNIGKQTIQYKSTGVEEIYTYTYDSHKNPFYQSFMELLEVGGSGLFCSENNILSSHEASNSDLITIYRYEYDEDNWPLKCVKKTEYGSPDYYLQETWSYNY